MTTTFENTIITSVVPARLDQLALFPQIGITIFQYALHTDPLVPAYKKRKNNIYLVAEMKSVVFVNISR